MQTDVLDPEAEKLFENAPFGSTRKYLNALSKRRGSLLHQLFVIQHDKHPRKENKTNFIEKQISDIENELDGYDHRKGSPRH